MIGLRSRGAIKTRINQLHHDALSDPLSNAEVDFLDAILQVRDRVPQALASLRNIATQMPALTLALTPALDRLEARMAAVTARVLPLRHLILRPATGAHQWNIMMGLCLGFMPRGALICHLLPLAGAMMH